MQKIIIASAVALASALPLSAAQAGGIKPGWNAYGQLQYGSGWRLYDTGCLSWNYQQHAWYTRCGLPQNGPLYPRPVVAKD